MSKKKPKAEEPAGESAPAWMVSFADLVTLLMSFFVVLYALKQGGPAQQTAVAAAIANQFAADPPLDSADPVDQAVLRLQGKLPPLDKSKGSSENPSRGPEGTHPEVMSMRGKEVTSGGWITFAAGSAELDETARATVRKIGEKLRGYTNVLMIKGHVSSDELALRPDDPDGLALSLRRAMTVKEMLVELGIDKRVLRPVACGPFEPMKVQVYDQESLRQNRRVEVYATDYTASDFVPSTLVAPAEGPGNAAPAEKKP